MNRNDTYERQAINLPDGFLYYRYFLDIDPVQDVDEADYVASVATLLTQLWQSEYKAVAACDFEDRLPRKGGYNPDRP